MAYSVFFSNFHLPFSVIWSFLLSWNWDLPNFSLYRCLGPIRWNCIVLFSCCCVSFHATRLHLARYPFSADFPVRSVPFCITRVSTRRSVTGRSGNPTDGSDIRQLRSSSLIISYFWGFSRIFRMSSGKPGNSGRLIRSCESPIFPEPFECESRLDCVGKVAQNIVSDFL